MDKHAYETLLSFHLFASFFESLEKWLSECERFLPVIKPETGDARKLCELVKKADIDDALREEYGKLLYGTYADVYVPLWASACKGQGPVLLNEVTLNAVKFYHRWGYEPKRIDGNPPDYIGSQLRFLEYMWACGINASKESPELEKTYRSAVSHFVQDFLLDSFTAVHDGVKCYVNDELIAGFFDWAGRFIAEGFEPAFTLVDFSEETFSGLESMQALKEGGRGAIPDGPEKMVLTAGVNDCGGRCVIKARTREGCVLEINTDQSMRDPKLLACVRGRSYRQTFFSANRLRYPLKRVGKRGEGKFKRITWEEAEDIIASEWSRISENYPPESRFIMMSTGNQSVVRGDAMAARLLNLNGGYLNQYHSYSISCVHEIAPYIYGDLLGSHSVDDVLNTSLLILWGHNPAETVFGTERNYYLTKAKEKGIKIIVVDPRRSDTAMAYADEWIGIRPSTDSALADGMAYVLWTEKLYDKEFMDKFCIGMDEGHMPEGIPPNESYEAYLLGKKDGAAKTPEWAEKITGVPKETIVRLAREYGAAKPACLMPGLGAQRTGSGEQTIRSLSLLTCLTGNVGIPGGGAVGGVWTEGHKAVFFPVLENPYKGSVSCFKWSQAVDEGTKMEPEKDGLRGVDKLGCGIKMIFCIASNTLVNQHSNINETVRILQDTDKCEFIVCSDLFMTASARFADLLLPAPSVFENDNFIYPWAYGNYILCNNKVIDPIFGCRFEWDWLKAVAEKLGYLEEFIDGRPEARQWAEHLYDELRKLEPELPDYKKFKEQGGYSYRNNTSYIAYKKQREDLDNNPFKTPSGKIEIFSKRIYDFNDPEKRPAIPKYVPCPEGPEDPLRNKYPLQLVGWHTKRRTHSMHDKNKWLEEVEPQRVWINPADAKKRGISDGDMVDVYNGRGRIRIKASVTPRVVEGVTGIPQGAWYTPDKDGVDTRGCINTLTSTHNATPFSKGPPQHTNLVEIELTKGK